MQRIQSKTSGLISAQDLLQLVKTGKSAFLRVKSYTSITRKVQWKQRFVILANNELYLYENEISSKPLHCIPLLGYNRIQRYDSQKYPWWSFCIVPAVKSMKQWVFSCSTDEERICWMRKVKDHMYKANNVQRPSTDQLNQFASGTEEDYLDLEELIFSPEKSVAESKNPDFSERETTDDDSELDSDDQGSGSGKMGLRKFSTSSQSSNRSLPPVPGDTKTIAPPSYKSVIEDLKKRKHVYQNTASDYADCSSSRFSLESCLITDPTLERDRDACRAMLMEKTHLGTYLIRKSRQNEARVLAVLTENSDVKEYRLEEKNKLYRLYNKENADFISIEALIEYYSHSACLPHINHYLYRGIFEENEDTYESIQE